MPIRIYCTQRIAGSMVSVFSERSVLCRCVVCPPHAPLPATASSQDETLTRGMAGRGRAWRWLMLLSVRHHADPKLGVPPVGGEVPYQYFDHNFYGVSSVLASSMEPASKAFYESSFEAIVDAGLLFWAHSQLSRKAHKIR